MGIFREVNVVEWPVKVYLPVSGNKKKKDTETFNIKFRIMDEEERRENQNAIPDLKDATPQEIAEFERKQIEIAVNNIEGWDLQNLEFTPDNLEKVINNHFYLKAILAAHREVQSGGELKN